MANRKNYYYILVFTNNGPVYVTSVSWQDKMTYWNELEKPKAFTKSMANDLVLGLACNGYSAVLVTTWYELGNQPYNYNNFECTFTKKE